MTGLRLAGKRALVTGAGTGIGRAVALAFAREGAAVALVGRRPDRLQDTSSAIADSGGTSLVFPADVSREDQIEAAVTRAEQAFRGLDTIVGVAGIELFREGDDRVDRVSLETWRRIISANLTGMFLTMKHGVRALIRNSGGSAIITGSPTALRGHALEEFAYSASKGGTHGMVRQMAADLAPEKIRVNCVIPGFIDTPINAVVLQSPEDLEAATAGIPMKRAGQPNEVAGIYVWLASDEASYTTGSFFVVDGGQISHC